MYQWSILIVENLCKFSGALNNFRVYPRLWVKKKEYRCTPPFVNLKSNTMKNTLQRYGFSDYLQIFQEKKYVL